VDRSFRDGAPDPMRIEGSCHRGPDRTLASAGQIPQDPTARLGRLHRRRDPFPPASRLY
jgi:hypothetical protein